MTLNMITIDFDNLFKEKYKNKYGVFIKSNWNTIDDVRTFLKSELNLKKLDLINEDGVYLGGFNSIEMIKQCKVLKAIYKRSENDASPIKPCIEDQPNSSNENDSDLPKRVNRKRKHKKLPIQTIDIQNSEKIATSNNSDNSLSQSQISKHIIFDDNGNDIKNKVIFKNMCRDLTSKPRFFSGYVLTNENSSEVKEKDENSQLLSDTNTIEN